MIHCNIVEKTVPLYSICVVFAPAVLACDGQDITKKSGHRKSRYLLSFPGVINELTAGGGKAGRLEQMDTPNPSFVLEFPEVHSLLCLQLGISSIMFLISVKI